MKQLKLMLLMAFFTLGFSSISFGQGTNPSLKNTVTRNACQMGYPGCYNGKVKLTLLAGNIGSSYEFTGITESRDYGLNYKKIKVKVDGLTSIGDYYLPTAIGEQIIITNGLDNGYSHAYTVGITKTGNNQYTISVGDYAY